MYEPYIIYAYGWGKFGGDNVWQKWIVKNLGEKSLTYKKALQKVITVTSYTNLDGFS